MNTLCSWFQSAGTSAMLQGFGLALVTLGVTFPARAQWLVCDPANTVESVITAAQEIASLSR